jgi:hypothetical protein
VPKQQGIGPKHRLTAFGPNSGGLLFNDLSDGSHACPENEVSFDYVWNGHGFSLLGKPVKKPVADCGSKAPPVGDIGGTAAQVEKARDAFLKQFMKEPALIISAVIIGTMVGHPNISAYRLGAINPQEFPPGATFPRGRDLLNLGIIHLCTFEKTNGLADVLNGQVVYNFWYRAELEVTETYTMATMAGPQNPNPSPTDFIIQTPSDRPDPNTVLRWIPKGTLFSIQGEILLHKTENGWVSE